MKKVVIPLIIVGIISIIAGVIWFLYGKMDVKLIGEEKVYTTINEEYKDLGFIITKNDKELQDGDYSVEKSDNIDNTKLGEYKISYDIKYRLRSFHLERVVIVVDDVKPEIKAKQESVTRDYCTKKDKDKLEYSVVDNYDGDITDKAILEENDNKYIITATDANNNTSTLEVPIITTKKPKDVFKLNGNSTVYVVRGNKYSDSGVTYTDGCGNKLNDKITTNSNVDTSKDGEYTVTYTAGNNKLTRKVIVYKPSDTSDRGSNGEKHIYLTFDDGPGVYTEKVLNTLAKYNVKATFFVTHQFASYVPLIKKEYEAGHSIAVHSYTHNWNVYKSVDAYVDDFNKMNKDVLKYTGSYTKIFRFPGGSSNTISRNYSKGVVKAIATRMLNDGYQYFDWDVDSGDAAGASRNKIYNNVVNGAKTCKKCIVLMHDIKPNTVNELDNILKTLTSQGYKFGTLSVNSPTVHHAIAN